MSELNPFPDYAVARLKTDAEIGSGTTVATPAIKAERALIDQYTNQWRTHLTNKNQPIEAIITAVRGDYGTGKTHLMLDAAARLKTGLIESYPDFRIIQIACRETDPLSWFRLSIGPEFLHRPTLNEPLSDEPVTSAGGFIERLMLRFYGAAGRAVAARTNLTKGAVDKLLEDPAAIRSLVRDNLLNVSAVDEEFSSLLQKTCPAVSQNIQRALGATVWVDTAAMGLRWLAGGQLTETERSLLRVSQNLADEEEASNVIVALAAVHRFLDTPFIIMFDELEHLTRYDQSQQAKRNITWLKRLLEGLATHQALTFVSGHWTAWEAQNDYLDRFSQLRPIELVKLTDKDVLDIIRQRVPSVATSTSFGTTQAQAIVQSTDGNIRRVLTLCRVLFRQTNGFTTTLSPDEILKAATELGQRITPDEAILRVRTILEQEGLTVRADPSTSGIIFDLIAYQGNDVRVVMDAKHAIHQADQLDQAKVFLDRVEELHKISPGVIACFLADGNVDDDLENLFRASRPFKLLWYDLTKADVMTRLTTDLRANLTSGTSAVALDASAAQLTTRKQENEELVVQLEDRIKAASANANADLVAQLENQRQGVQEQITQLNEQLTRREDDLRAEFLRNLRSQIDELDQKRSYELRELYARLEAERAESRSKREEATQKQPDEDAPKLNVTYAELTRPVSLSRKIQMALAGPQFLVILIEVVGGFILAYTTRPLAGSLAISERTFYAYQAVFYGTSFLAVATGLLSIWLRMAKVEAFFDYTARTLREVYLRSPRVEDLVRADNILRDSWETHGLLRWKRQADARLWDELGGMVGQPDDNYMRMKYASAGPSTR